MSMIPSYIFSTVLVLLSLHQTTSTQVVIGVIIDGTSRAGKEANVSLQIALDDITRKTDQRLVLRLTNSHGKPALAALSAKRLIDAKEVQVVVGPHTWQEASRVAEVSSQGDIPMFSLADLTPRWAIKHWPFLVQASVSNQELQMKAVAASVQSWDWHRVNIIYEDDTDSAFGSVIPDLMESLQEVGAEISHLVPLQSGIASSLSEELTRLREQQFRVFVVHTSIKLATHLFQKAKEMKMMEKDYIWIVTNTIADFFHSLDLTTISSMQGVIGVKKYFPTSSIRFVDFRQRFQKKFSLDYPEEGNDEPGISAVEAYNVLWAVAHSFGGRKVQFAKQSEMNLDKVSFIHFDGLTGRVQFNGRKLSPSSMFGVVNVIGKSFKELGIWSKGLGFSKNIDNNAIHNSSMQNLGPVNWPGHSLYIPEGWGLSNSSGFWRIGVPTGSMLKQMINIFHDPQTNKLNFTGFEIDTFREVMARLPYYVPYEFIPYSGTYDFLVEQVYLKKFDGIVGVSVIADGYKYAEFTCTYTRSSLAMLVPVQSKTPSRAWLFMKPFTKATWLLILAITIYNGFVIWLIERNHNWRLQGSATDQAGILIWLSFTTLFSLQGRLHSNLSRIAVVVWLFVALIITQSYSASLISMLTVQKLEAKISDIETLKTNNAIVGHPKGYYGFINASDLKIFLAEHCKSFVVAGPSYKVGGHGFAFPKGSPIIADLDKALLEFTECGKLRELEDKMIGEERCVEADSSNDDEVSLGLNSFWILFLFTGGTTTCSLAIYTLDGLRKAKTSQVENSGILTALLKYWKHQRSRFTRKFSDVENSDLPNA
ncbi:Glutamate receptor [Heracleum sosnowskyi]|uniref:Glutamate receptor n=1 Tax=Heracleum sosnowskyi TaxID=360622 RepID=A0AAD8JNH6_9APIA|nr:Glutamate receptor [Heracleum sosnowskyi]